MTSNKNAKYKKTASGISTSLWNKLTQNATSMQSIQLNNPSWSLSLFTALTLFLLTKSPEKNKIIHLQHSETAYRITLSDVGINGGEIEQYSGSLTHDVRGELNQGDDWKVTKKAVNNTIEIPPYSITLIEE